MNTKIKDGDIFFWSWKDEQKHKQPMVYWAKSRFAVAKDGMVQDTFWNNSHDGFSMSHDRAFKELELNYLGNFADLEKKPEYMSNYYDEKDVVNLNHSNSTSGNFYVRKGAQRSKERMKQYLEYHIEKEEGTIRFALSSIKTMKKSLLEIEEGKSLDKIYL